jgi:glycerol-3-phosphate cytidylyltransferase
MTYERGIIAGSFDILHPGYIRMFEESKRVVSYLIVALQDDPTVDRPEKCKPVQTWEERAEILKSLRYVDDVVYYNTEYDLRKLLGSVKYDVRILGSDYLGRRFTGDDLEKPVFYCNRNHQYSLTDLKERIAESMLNR